MCMSGLISFVLADSSCLPCEKKRKSQYEKFLPTAGFEPAMSRLLDWRSNVLSYFGSDCRHFKRQIIYILISIQVRRNTWWSKKVDRSLDHALKCKAIIQNLNFFCYRPLQIHFSSRTQCNTRQHKLCTMLNFIYTLIV